MIWLRRLFGRMPAALTIEQQLALAAHRALPVTEKSAPLATMRFVVADVETTGLRPEQDRLISIGAVVVERGTICLSESFEIIFRQPQASKTANILIHRIDGTTQTSGLPHAEAMLEFLDYAGTTPLVGYHSNFDKGMINRAARAAIGGEPVNEWLDLACLAPAAFDIAETKNLRSLDDWLQWFGIYHQARHNALSDALATAQLLQIVLAQAMKDGAQVLGDLVRMEQEQRWLRQINKI